MPGTPYGKPRSNIFEVLEAKFVPNHFYLYNQLRSTIGVTTVVIRLIKIIAA